MSGRSGRFAPFRTSRSEPPTYKIEAISYFFPPAESPLYAHL